jgi:hypothetical protein
MSTTNNEIFLSIVGAVPFVLLAIYVLAVPARRLKSLGLVRAYRWQLVGAAGLLLYGPVREGPALLFSLTGEPLRPSAMATLIILAPAVLLLVTFFSLAASATADRDRSSKGGAP